MNEGSEEEMIANKCPKCGKTTRLAWSKYLTIYESFEFLQCMNCGEILARRNYAKGASKE